MTEAHCALLERIYLVAPVNRSLGVAISVSPGTAEIRMPVGQQWFHAADAVHGSVLFKLLDDAAYFAANSQVTDVLLLTADFTIHFVRPVSEGVVTATGHLVHSGRTRSIAESVAVDEAGKTLAIGRGNYVRSRQALAR